MSQTVSASPIRVFLLLENRLLRDALHRILHKRSDLLIFGCDKPAECSLQKLMDTQCNVLVLDFFDIEWLPTKLRVRNVNLSQLKALLIGMDSDKEQFLAAVRGGVTGYLVKEASVSDVVAAVHATFRGDAVCSPELCASVFEYVSQMSNGEIVHCSDGRPGLSLRQRKLIALVAKGMTNKEIASHLNLSEYTIRNHVHRIMKRVDARSRSHAVEKALLHGYGLTT